MTAAPLVAGVELGGTKCIAVIARGREILDRLAVPTEAPGTTLPRLSSWLAERNGFAALGLSSFGPLALDPAHPRFGQIVRTPKAGWSGADVRGYFAQAFAGPIGFDTDVNAAGLAEGLWGAAHGCDVHVYVTVGTGIGAGVIVNNRPVHGLLHPEIGHIRVRRARADDFAGVCPYHADCLEGLASGPAVATRAGAPADTLPPDHPVWAEVASELGELVAILALAVSPRRVLIGGGLGVGQGHLLPRVRTHAALCLAGYVDGYDEAALGAIVRPPRLGADAGPLGAVALALAASAGGEQR